MGIGAYDTPPGGKDILQSTVDKGIRLFYNSEKNGVQLGGVLGALLGFGAGMFITAGGGFGWLGLATIGLLTIVGANTGNKVADWMGNKTQSTTPVVQTPAKTVSAIVQNTEKALSEALKKGPSAQNADKIVTNGDTGKLSSPHTPKSAAQAAAERTV